MAYQINDRIGDYQIVDVLGAGGMGKVYKVRNIISDRIEAMKVLLPNLESDPELADRFMREIKVQASLQHPNIAGLHTALRVNNQLLMLIEFVEGQTIEQQLRSGPIPLEKAIHYIKQALAALSYAHSHGVVHRDIKPANMMLTPADVVKLMDFGIAKMTADRRLTQTGRTVGSLYYMSPEQIQGSATLDGRSDLYSVGVTLYELLTNSRPFQGDSDYSIMAAHLNSAPVPPIQLDPSLPPSLNDIVLMAIEKDPSRRFQTAEAFRSALATVEASMRPAVISSVPHPGSATGIGYSAPAASYSPTTPTATLSADTQKGKRGLYMAVGSVVTVLVLAVAAFQVPKWIAASEASTATPSSGYAEPVVKADPPASSPPAAVEAGTTSTSGATSSAANSTSPTAGSTPSTAVYPTQAAAPAPTRPGTTTNSNTAPPSSTLVAQANPPAVRAPEPAPQAQAAPQAAVSSVAQSNPAEEKELDDLGDRLVQLGTRANSVRGSLNGLRRQMGGLSLNAEFSTREQRMETYLDQAEAALKSRNVARAKRDLDSAERALEELEKKLGH